MQAYPIENTARKSHYVARVIGPHDTYKFDREFLRGKYVKSRKVREYRPADIGADHLPAWLVRTPERVCHACQRPMAKETHLIEAREGYWIDHGPMSADEILTIWQMGLPGSEDAWTPSDVCSGCAAILAGGGMCESCDAGRVALAQIEDLPIPA